MELVNNDYRAQAVLGRLETVIDNENQRIGKDPDFDFKLSNAHKSRCLYELSMLLRDVDGVQIATTHKRQILDIKEKLAINTRRVEANLNAVKAVVDLLKNDAKRAEDDGTYSLQQFAREAQ
ncbi:hypothetical protein RMR16_001140 [Agrobacterium sp. rho-13.3]|jgi:hypothetical protein|uniref:hypothetical protein n=1 Tax=Agrobacterium sp. rho-13.3 TaxID=3072980 RepID=UPI002A100B98|nr:hypothetical protein [Agrobacterium sp. rho-13.3]MDX8310467.1 hypothetical protein [Agrobacterium sp. rho-13.3]